MHFEKLLFYYKKLTRAFRTKCGKIFSQNICEENKCCFNSLKYIFWLIERLKSRSYPRGTRFKQKELTENWVFYLNLFSVKMQGLSRNITTTHYSHLFLITNTLLTLLLNKSILLFYVQVPNGFLTITTPMHWIENKFGALKD